MRRPAAFASTLRAHSRTYTVASRATERFSRPSIGRSDAGRTDGAAPRSGKDTRVVRPDAPIACFIGSRRASLRVRCFQKNRTRFKKTGRAAGNKMGVTSFRKKINRTHAPHMQPSCATANARATTRSTLDLPPRRRQIATLSDGASRVRRPRETRRLPASVAPRKRSDRPRRFFSLSSRPRPS